MASVKGNVSPNYFCNYGSSTTNISDALFCNSFIDEDISSGELFRALFDEGCSSSLWKPGVRLDQKDCSDTVSISIGKPPVCKSIFASHDDEDIDVGGYTKKPTDEWTKVDTINWLISVSGELGHSYGRMSPDLAMSGKELLRLGKESFIKHDPNFGESLYDLLRDKRDSIDFLPHCDASKFCSDDENSVESNSASSADESVDGSICSRKRRPGRPPLRNPKNKEPRVKLWEFLKNFLLDPDKWSHLICWEDYDTKTFRLVQNRQIAKLWGKRNNKENSTMNYEKFSRAMRYYYKKQIFESVPGRRLVYKFGKMATGLEAHRPNFGPDYKNHRNVAKA